MPNEQRKGSTGRFPLRLMPSVRRNAETFSAKEGVSLNQFINVAVAEKLAHLEHEQWMRRRKPLTEADVEEGLRLLDKAGSKPSEAGDELPKGYKTVRERIGSGRNNTSRHPKSES